MTDKILMSIKPKWCEMIFSGQKIDEIRKTKPNGPLGQKYIVYIWQTDGGGIVGRFTVRVFSYMQAYKDEITGEKHLTNQIGLRHCVSDQELFDYLYGNGQKPGKPYPGGWAWRIEQVMKFPKPLGLDFFGLKKPPQSWQYVNFA